MKLSNYVLILVVSILLPIVAPAAPADARPSGDSLARRINSLLNKPGLREGFQGVLIKSLKSGRTLYARNADSLFVPASNNKILTACAALGVLGIDFRWHTRVLATSRPDKDGVVNGDLVLQGSGDPILTADDLNALAGQLKAAGIHRITGNLRFDDYRFDRQFLGETWAWDDEPYYYSAQISALNVDENVVVVHVQPGTGIGDPVGVSVTPLADYATVHCTAVTTAKGTPVGLDVTRRRGRNTILISGSLPAGIAPAKDPAIAVTYEDPPRFAATLFRSDLIKAGIEIAGGTLEGHSPVGAVLLADHLSPAMPEVLRRLNKPSDNLIAECLLKSVGAQIDGQGTGGEGGTACLAARTWFRTIGLRMSEVRQADGSGLSRDNFVSPRNIVRTLVWFTKQPWFRQYDESLPVAGVDGTLARRMKGTAAAGNCHAKTGYVSHVSTISGYVRTADGQPLVFSILMNNHLCPNRVCEQAQDAIVVLLASLRGNAGAHQSD
ncbi:MAG: D-alanyl-D-alanine carboxypeptidase/D-alanyl-D-alanine-endopeptidase [Armatimonadetes bacterium]|nr:D-alanyl-D-alanine carboxypeptidase/D-alanyl-D-alanine-endopeptidase [Armatimonadota bacterium]MDE2207107.1 D-alanyl-D-alanine carboxypeptidase/D-alanyl-D-alanine-endopeptidase [Armatimonadota bacterium]